MEYTNKNNFENVEVGDSVWSPEYGIGEVLRIIKQYIYVRFKFSPNKWDIGYNIDELSNRPIGYSKILYWQKPDWWEDDKFPIKPKWRASINESYFHVDSLGKINMYIEKFTKNDNRAFQLGNYFRNFDDAKNSKFYKVFDIDENEEEMIFADKMGCVGCKRSKYYIKNHIPEYHKRMMERPTGFEEYKKTKFCRMYDSLKYEEKQKIAEGRGCMWYSDKEDEDSKYKESEV